jgi:hypothetical protein
MPINLEGNRKIICEKTSLYFKQNVPNISNHYKPNVSFKKFNFGCVLHLTSSEAYIFIPAENRRGLPHAISKLKMTVFWAVAPCSLVEGY